ncbi:MAG: 50S ribosomal protein L9 [Sedimentisphaerales bacterium]|nr:50S ribosomal protein L9 [Sedimentisphaerales bacterium]
MKLLLHADIPKLGYFGDVVEVSTGYARNYLLPHRLAVEPTEANVRAIEEERAQKAQKRQLERSRLMKTSESVQDAEVTITALANDTGHLFGSVSESDIAKTLCQAGYEVQTKHVQMNEHIRMLGIHEIKLRFAEDIMATVSVHVVRPEDEAHESGAEPDTEKSDDIEQSE